MDFQIKDGVLKKYLGHDLTVIIPEGVTEIGKNVFMNYCIEKVVIPHGVTSIGKNAFGMCGDLQEITLPDTLVSISEGAFACCHSLQEITLPDSLREIGDRAFGMCNLQAVTIPEGVTEIGYETFTSSDLVSITLPSTLKCIRRAAFYNCDHLAEVHFPEGLTEIDESAFSGCSALQDVTLPESLKRLGWRAFLGTPWFKRLQEQQKMVILKGVVIDGELCEGDVTVPEGVTAIGEGAFALNRGITSVKLPESVTEIGAGAFEDCGSLTKINLPAGVTRIEKQTFYRCEKLEQVNIPAGVTAIGELAFCGCKMLDGFTIPAGVTEVGRAAFYDTIWLEQKKRQNPAVILNSMLIDAMECKGDVVIPEGVTAIADGAFWGYNTVTSVMIPASVKHIGKHAFGECRELHRLCWAGHCSVDSICLRKDSKKRYGTEICEALKMVESKDFSVKLDHGVKFPFIAGMYRETGDAEALAYLKKQAATLMKLYITNGDTDGISYLLTIPGIVTRRNIDKCLELAVAQKQHEIYTMLVRYKAETLGFKDITDQFKL